jgi:hypothetical protein
VFDGVELKEVILAGVPSGFKLWPNADSSIVLFLSYDNALEDSFTVTLEVHCLLGKCTSGDD